MSWTRRAHEVLYEEFAEVAENSIATVAQSRWSLDILEISDNGEVREYARASARRLPSKAGLRIVFAPLDLAQRDTKGLMLELFHKFGVPNDFTTERVRSVNHSFGHRTSENGFSSWFHFQCKNITIGREDDRPPEVEKHTSRMRYHTLPQADYSWQRSGFFLQALNDGSATLVCFGALPRVQKRITDFLKSRVWHDVCINQYILFDLVLEGLHGEVDATIGNMNRVFGPLEHLILELANSGVTRSTSTKLPFAALHNCSKHTIDLAEALEACIMVVDNVISNVGSAHNDAVSSPSSNGNRWQLVEQQLRECLAYRRSLFRSTQLGLSNLQRRIDAATTLSSNLMTQQDSSVMTQDSSSLKIIAVIIMIFLPTTGVATVVGSQLLVSEQDEVAQAWNITATPLFWVTWWIAIPLTVGVVALALGWLWWMHGGRPRGEVLASVRRAVKRNPLRRKREKKDTSVV